MDLSELAALGVLAQGVLDNQSTLAELVAKVNAMSDQQAELNTDVANLVTALSAISDEIAALKNANPALDLSGLEAAVAQAQGLVPAPPAAG